MKKPEFYTYIAIFTRENDGGYSVRFPMLDGCFTQGDNFNEAEANAKDAMSLYLYSLERDGGDIPEPQLEADYITAPNQFAMAVRVWMPDFRSRMDNRSVKKTLTIPAWMNDVVERMGLNCSQLLQSAIQNCIDTYTP